MGTKNKKKSDDEKISSIQLLITLINGIVPIWVAIITCLGAIVVAYLSYRPSNGTAPTPAPILTDVPILVTTEVPMPIEPTVTTIAFDTITPSPIYTETLPPSFTPSETFTPTSTFTPIPLTATFTLAPGLPIGMQVKVIANPSRGRPPLTVRLDARDSYLRAPNGDIFECRNGACKYTWYLTVTGGQPEEQDSKSGFIQLTFDKRGTYYINVYVCHGSDNPTCNSGGAIVIVE